MKGVKPGGAYYGEFTTADATGAATDATGTPVATANHNGTDDATFTLTVAKIDAGRYKVTGTVPAGYAVGDQFSVSIAATVGGVAAKAVVDDATVIWDAAGNTAAYLADVAHGGSSAVLTLDHAVINSVADHALDIYGGTNKDGLHISGNGTGHGAWVAGGASGKDVLIYGNLVVDATGEYILGAIDWNDVQNRPTIGTSTLTTQNVRDAMKLAPTAGDPAAGSVDKQLDDVNASTVKFETMIEAV